MGWVCLLMELGPSSIEFSKHTYFLLPHIIHPMLTHSLWSISMTKLSPTSGDKIKHLSSASAHSLLMIIEKWSNAIVVVSFFMLIAFGALNMMLALSVRSVLSNFVSLIGLLRKYCLLDICLLWGRRRQSIKCSFPLVGRKSLWRIWYFKQGV